MTIIIENITKKYLDLIIVKVNKYTFSKRIYFEDKETVEEIIKDVKLGLNSIKKNIKTYKKNEM